jgi:uncharacterized protein (TIGR02466 family)
MGGVGVAMTVVDKMEVKEIFPTPVWVVDLKPDAARALNARLVPEIERLISPRPPIQPGSNWQTDPVLHTLPAFGEFITFVETAARGVLRFLRLDHMPVQITGCWANINPPGAYHPLHHHPNNYLSGVYYAKAGSNASVILFQDPRPQASIISPPHRELTPLTVSASAVEARSGRLVIFPAWLKHTVPTNATGEDRISISFNLMFPQFTESYAQPLWKGSAPTPR